MRMEVNQINSSNNLGKSEVVGHETSSEEMHGKRQHSLNTDDGTADELKEIGVSFQALLSDAGEHKLLRLALHMLNIAIEELHDKQIKDYISAVSELFLSHSRSAETASGQSRSCRDVRVIRQPNRIVQKVSGVPVKTTDHGKPSLESAKTATVSGTPDAVPHQSNAKTRFPTHLTGKDVPPRLRRQSSFALGSRSCRYEPVRDADNGGTHGTGCNDTTTVTSKNIQGVADSRDTLAKNVERCRQTVNHHEMPAASSLRNSTQWRSTSHTGAARTQYGLRSTRSVGVVVKPFPRARWLGLRKAAPSKQAWSEEMQMATYLAEPLRTRHVSSAQEDSSSCVYRHTSPYVPLLPLRDTPFSATPLPSVSSFRGTPRSTRSIMVTPRGSQRQSVRRARSSARHVPSDLKDPQSPQPHTNDRDWEAGAILLVDSASTDRYTRGGAKEAAEYNKADRGLEWSCANSHANEFTTSYATHSSQRLSQLQAGTQLVGVNRSTLTGLYNWPAGKYTALSAPYPTTLPQRLSIKQFPGEKLLVDAAPAGSEPPDEESDRLKSEDPSDFVSRHFVSSTINSVLECIASKAGDVLAQDGQSRGDQRDDTDGDNDDVNSSFPTVRVGDILLECDEQPLIGALSLKRIVCEALSYNKDFVTLRVLRGAESLLVREPLQRDGELTNSP
uniref:PDZ domain-containing protein n=1 Tax=Trypanosoma congolense (strain IL3000) TaxID=1068625 RepID=G0UJ57_TRYCI|nr:conserved hypothetical protein [Trypanosoma congolense IL3000]